MEVIVMLNYKESKAIVSAINEQFNGARKATDLIRQTLELSKQDSGKAQAVLIEVAIHLATNAGKSAQPDSQQPKFVSFRNMVAREAQAMLDAGEWNHANEDGDVLAWTLSVKKGVVSVAFKRKRAPRTPNGDDKASPAKKVAESENLVVDTCFEHDKVNGVLQSLARQAKRAGVSNQSIVEYFGGVMLDDESIIDIEPAEYDEAEEQAVIGQVVNG